MMAFVFWLLHLHDSFFDPQVCSTASTMQESLRQLRMAKESRRKAATTKAVTFVTGVGLVAGGAGLTATGFGEHFSYHEATA